MASVGSGRRGLDPVKVYNQWYTYIKNEHPDWAPEMVNNEAKLRSAGGKLPPSGGGTITDITTPQKGIDVDNSDATPKGTYPFLVGDKQFDIPSKQWTPGLKQRAAKIRAVYEKGGWKGVRDYLVNYGFSNDLPVPSKGQNGFVVSATESFLKKGKSNLTGWNNWFASRYGNPDPSPPGGTDLPADTTDGNGNPIYPGGDPTSVPGAGGIELDPTTGAIIANISNALAGELSLINPSLYSRSLAAEKYNPTLAELRRQIALQANQGKQNLQNIQDWYKTSSDQYTETAGDLARAGEASVNANLQAANSIANSIGVPVSPVTGTAESGFLQSIAATDQSWANKMAALTTTSRNDALVREQGALSQERDKLRSDLLSTQRAKADYRQQAQEAAIGTRLEQLQAYINMALGLGQFDLSKAKLNADLNDPTNALQQEYLRSQITQNNAQTDAIINDILNPSGDPTGVTQWSDLTAGDFSDLSAALTTGVDPTKMTPLQVANLLGDRLRVTSGGAWDPKQNQDVRAWRNQLLYQLYPGQKKLIDRMLAANPALRA